MTDHESPSRRPSRRADQVEPPMDPSSGEGEHQDGMRGMSGAVIAHHRVPAPAAQPAGRPFPRPVLRGLVVSIVIGALVGAAVAAFTRVGFPGYLPRAEQLQSMGDATFYTFWILAGIAAGIATGGTLTVLTAKPDGQSHHRAPDQS